MFHNEMVAALQELATLRPVFHSEADFQHALAWLLADSERLRDVRLERPFDLGGRRLKIDLVGRSSEGRVAIELKYWQREFRFRAGDEEYALKNRAAQDLARHDFWRDVARIEALVGAAIVTAGYVIALTNDASYWREGTTGTVDAAFRLSEGRRVRGALVWGQAASRGTTKGRDTPVEVANEYVTRWSVYSRPADHEFRHLVVRVDGDASARSS